MRDRERAKPIHDQGERKCSGDTSRGSGRAPEVLVMKATKVWEGDHFTECSWLYGSRFWALLVQRQVSSRGMVIDKVGIEQSFKVAFIQYNDMV